MAVTRDNDPLAAGQRALALHRRITATRDAGRWPFSNAFCRARSVNRLGGLRVLGMAITLPLADLAWDLRLQHSETAWRHEPEMSLEAIAMRGVTVHRTGRLAPLDSVTCEIMAERLGDLI